MHYGGISADTARNVLPAVFKRVKETFGWHGTANFDLGSGPFNKLSEALKKLDIINLKVDPRHYNSTYNQRNSLSATLNADTATVSNVLNVLPTKMERRKVLLELARVMRLGCVVYITVNEGTRSGIKRCWKRDGQYNYQLNRPLKWYLKEVQSIFPYAYITNKMIVVPITRKILWLQSSITS